MIRFGLFLLALTALPVAAKDLRFQGIWDCGVATMTFTATTYDPGTGPMVMKTIEGDGHDFTIGFADGYTITISVSDDERSMQWLSHATGDSLSCSRKG